MTKIFFIATLVAALAIGYASGNDSKQCKSCVEKVNKLHDLVSSPKLVADAELLLKQACVFQKTAAAQAKCEKDVTKHVEELQAKLLEMLAKPEEHLCKAVCQKTEFDFLLSTTGPKEQCDECIAKINQLKAKLDDLQKTATAVGEGLCQNIPAEQLKKECFAVVDQAVAMFVNKIKLALKDPKLVCQQMHQCPANDMALFFDTTVQDDSPLCTECQQTIQNVKAQLTSQDLAERANLLLDVGCLAHPEAIDQCKTQIAQTVAEFQANVSRCLADPLALCQKAKLCKSTQLANDEEQQVEPCEQCQSMVNHLFDQIFAPTTGVLAQLKVNVEAKLCSALPDSLKEKCKTEVEAVLDMVFANLKQALSNPKAVCQKAKMCPEQQQLAALNNNGNCLCDKCVKEVQSVKDFATSAKTANVANTLLGAACALQAENVQQCKAQVAAQIAQLQANISQALADPKQVCVNAHLCSKQQDDKSLLMYILGHQQLQFGDAKCDQCKAKIADLFEKLFGVNGAVAQLKSAIETNVCSKLPPSMLDQCKSTIEQLVDKLLAGLKAKLSNPTKACQDAGACPK